MTGFFLTSGYLQEQLVQIAAVELLDSPEYVRVLGDKSGIIALLFDVIVDVRAALADIVVLVGFSEPVADLVLCP